VNFTTRPRPDAAIRICHSPAIRADSGSRASARDTSPFARASSQPRKLAWMSAWVVDVMFGMKEETRANAPVRPPATAHRIPAAAPRAM
jgi:hypothetical protein